MSVYEIRLDPDEDAVDGRYLDNLLDRWLQHCVTQSDPQTVNSYREKLLHFRRWWKKLGPVYDWRLTRSLLVEFELYLRSWVARTGEPLSYNTRYDVIRRLRSALKWAYETNRISVNCRAWVPTPDGETPTRMAATLAQLEDLMSSTFGRDQAILALLIGTGIRRVECARLNVEHIFLCSDSTGLAEVTGKRTKANKSGKREIALDRLTVSYLAKYIVDAGLTSGPLFCNARTGKRLTCQGIYKVVKHCVHRAGLSEYIQACHDLRRAFATHYTNLFPDNVHADFLRRQLGHAHYKQTAEYNLMSADDLRPHIVSPLAAMMGNKKPAL